MHELPILNSLLKLILPYAKEQNDAKIKKVILIVGDLTDLLDEWMQHYFQLIAKDTAAENADLKIIRIPAVIQCRACSRQYVLNREDMESCCPNCQSKEGDLLTGREFMVDGIEIEEPPPDSADQEQR